MRDRAPIWIGLSDLLLCTLSVVIVAVAPHSHAKGPEQKAEFLITADWDINADADVDLWVRTPRGRPVMYANREEGCSALDRDSRGYLDSRVALPGGAVKIVDSQKETVAMRCIEPGRYDVGAHLYAYQWHEGQRTDEPYGVKVHIEVIRLNPEVTSEWVGDVTLDRGWQFDNAISFDLSPDGKLTVVEPPLEPFADGYYRKAAP